MQKNGTDRHERSQGVMARIQLPIDHKTWSKRPPFPSSQPKQHRRNSRINHTEEQPHDNTTTINEHAESVRQLIQKRNSTPNEDRQSDKQIHQQNDPDKDTHDQKRRKKTQHRKHLEPSINTKRTKVHITYMQNKKRQQQVRQIGHCHGVLRGAQHLDEVDTRTRGQLRSTITRTHTDAVHHVGTQQRDQPTQKRQSCRHDNS